MCHGVMVALGTEMESHCRGFITEEGWSVLGFKRNTLVVLAADCEEQGETRSSGRLSCHPSKG